MQSRVRILGHPVHPAAARLPLVAFPLLVAFDILWRLTGSAAFWEVGGWLGMAAIGAGIVAILTGTIDLAAIPEGTRAHRVALWHFFGGLAVHSCYICSVWARWPVGSEPRFADVALGFDLLGLALAIVQGYLGTELRGRHHIGIPTVAEGADPVTLKR